MGLARAVPFRPRPGPTPAPDRTEHVGRLGGPPTGQLPFLPGSRLGRAVPPAQRPRLHGRGGGRRGCLPPGKAPPRRRFPPRPHVPARSSRPVRPSGPARVVLRCSGPGDAVVPRSLDPAGTPRASLRAPQAEAPESRFLRTAHPNPPETHHALTRRRQQGPAGGRGRASERASERCARRASERARSRRAREALRGGREVPTSLPPPHPPAAPSRPGEPQPPLPPRTPAQQPPFFRRAGPRPPARPRAPPPAARFQARLPG